MQPAVSGAPRVEAAGPGAVVAFATRGREALRCERVRFRDERGERAGHREIGNADVFVTGAEEQFRAEAKLQPGDAEPAYRLGNSLLQEGKIQEAKAELERADRLRPGMPETLYALGKAQSLSGDVTGAEKSWQQVLALEKNGPIASQTHFGLSGLYRKQGKTEEAERELQAYRQLQTPKSPVPK